jgi:PAS domain S-box-containing protein
MGEILFFRARAPSFFVTCADTIDVKSILCTACHGIIIHLVIIKQAASFLYSSTMTVASGIMNMLRVVFPPTEVAGKSSARQFLPAKELCETDNILVDMLNSQGHENVSFCVCDPHLPDMPIIFASEGFCNFTGYSYGEIEGKNCRFLQGPDTKQEEVDRIRKAIQNEEELSVNLLNYRKNGTKFVNEFFISPLRDKQKKLQYVRVD